MEQEYPFPEYYRVNAERHRAIKHGKRATLTLNEWEKTILDFNGLCAYCLQRPYTLLEHFIPVEMEGTHVRNCVPACRICNARKRDRTGEKLIAVFGEEAVNRVRVYLESRIETPAKAGVSESIKVPMSGETLLQENYVAHEISLENATKKLGVTRAMLYRYMKSLMIESFRYPLDRKSYLSLADFERIQTLKEQARQRSSSEKEENAA